MVCQIVLLIPQKSKIRTDLKKNRIGNNCSRLLWAMHPQKENILTGPEILFHLNGLHEDFFEETGKTLLLYKGYN